MAPTPASAQEDALTFGDTLTFTMSMLGFVLSGDLQLAAAGLEVYCGGIDSRIPDLAPREENWLLQEMMAGAVRKNKGIISNG